MLTKSAAGFGFYSSLDGGFSELPCNSNKSGYGKSNVSCRCFRGHCIAVHSILHVPDLTAVTYDERQELVFFTPYDGQKTRSSLNSPSDSPITVGRESTAVEDGFPCDIPGYYRDELFNRPDHKYVYPSHAFRFLNNSSELVCDLIQRGDDRNLPARSFSGEYTRAPSILSTADRKSGKFDMKFHGDHPLKVASSNTRMEKRNGQLNSSIHNYDKIFEASTKDVQGDASKEYGDHEEQDLCDVIRYQQDISAFANLTQKFLRSKDVRGGRELHLLIVINGLEDCPFIASHLIRMFSSFELLPEAQRVFSKLNDPNVYSWSAIISAYAMSGDDDEALELYLRMCDSLVEPDGHTFVVALKACSSLGKSEQGRTIHCRIIESGLESDIYIGSAIINMYSNCGNLADAYAVFERLPERNTVTWSALIKGYWLENFGEEALKIFTRMKQEGMEPDHITYVSILKACSSVFLGQQIRKIHAEIIETGYESNEWICNALVDSYSQYDTDASRIMFNRLQEQSNVSCSVLIAGYTQHNCGLKALQVYEEMQQKGMQPDIVIFICVLKACTSIAALKDGQHVHAHIIEMGFEAESPVGVALIDLYTKCGCLEIAELMLLRIPGQDIAAWNALVTGYSQHDDDKQVLLLFDQLQKEGFDPDSITFVSVLAACRSLDRSREIHNLIIQKGLELDARVNNALVDSYAKSGSLGDAHMMFERHPNRDIVTWSSLIGGYVQHNQHEVALEIFEGMQENGYAHDGDYYSAVRCFEGMQQAGIQPDDVAFLSLFSACSRSADLVDEGCWHFRSMRDDYGILPKVEHCNSMLDLLGNVGFLSEAEDLLETVPCSSNVIGWTSLLNSCKVHRSIEIGRRCFNYIVSLDVANAAGYVLMSDIYAKFGMWEDAKRVQELRKHVNGWKKPAKAYIEIDQEVHSFIVGDRVHPRSSDIYAKLKSLNEQMQHEGYEPNVDLSFESDPNEEKTAGVCEHAEKLAVAFGLLGTAQGSTIRVSKNLRMCPDCHTATKLISKIEMREIIIADTHCIHRFLDGQCSCACNY